MSCVLPVEQRAHVEGPSGLCAHTTPEAMPLKKRLIICCDGTTNNANEAKWPIGLTNVGRMSNILARKCCNGMPQVVYYHRGVGGGSSKAGQAVVGYGGIGIEHDIKDSYRFICDNYCPGDEIVLVGFSRGAFTARAVAGVVCSIGLLNSFGLRHFRHVFDDYQEFNSWTRNTPFDAKVHLNWFRFKDFTYTKLLYQTLENVLGSGYLSRFGYDLKKDPDGDPFANGEKSMPRWREMLFEALKRGRPNNMPRRVIHTVGSLYAIFLGAMEMIHCQGAKALEVNQDLSRETATEKGAGASKIDWEPREVRIKAVGVWDTVGSIGVAKGTTFGDVLFWRPTKRELRFKSLIVHERVENAFHALSLDEWRSGFRPTLWSKADGNETTHLRQVWFPGSHSDVGGGLEEQQIATISLAWMADQLSALGVEFVPCEMERVFRVVDFSSERIPRSWGLGRIHAPGVTGLFNSIRDALARPYKAYKGESEHYAARTPGYYKDDHSVLLRNTNELIHPSVRIRYLYGGREFDDETDYECQALSCLYTLRNGTSERPLVTKELDMSHASTFQTLHGEVCAIRGGMPIADNNNNHVTVAKQLPFEHIAPKLLYMPYEDEEWTWETLRHDTPGNLNSWDWGLDRLNDGEIRRNRQNDREIRPNRQYDDGEWRFHPLSNVPTIGRWFWESHQQHEGVPWTKDGEGKLILHEERIGMWERLLLTTVQENLDTNNNGNEGVDPRNQGLLRSTKRALSGAARLLKKAGNLPGNLLMKVVYTISPKRGRETLDKKYLTYGYYNFIAWQHGDLRHLGGQNGMANIANAGGDHD